MTRESACLKLRELLGLIWEEAIEEFDGVPDIQDACRLLELEQGRSIELLMVVVEEAGLTPLTPLEYVFMDEDGG
jgi:hypothetical protein